MTPPPNDPQRETASQPKVLNCPYAFTEGDIISDGLTTYEVLEPENGSGLASLINKITGKVEAHDANGKRRFWLVRHLPPSSPPPVAHSSATGADAEKHTATPADEWKWFGNAGHFICGRWCRFHLCTLVGPWLVSTVGEYVHPRHARGGESPENEWLKKNPLGEEIGCGRKFETMVFAAGKPCTNAECGCGLPELCGSELDTDAYNDRASATAGHLAMCQKWAKSKPTGKESHAG